MGMDQFKRCDQQVQRLVAEEHEQSDSLIEKQDSIQSVFYWVLCPYNYDDNNIRHLYCAVPI